MARGAETTGSGGGGALYYEISNFQSGMDLRKSALTAPAGTLRMLQNAHITPGGEVEKRSTFAYWCTAPAGSLGICDVNNQVYTHLPAAAASIVPPTASAVGVINIVAPAGVTLQYMYSYDVYNGQIFAVFPGSDGHWYCYYNGVLVPDATDKCTDVRTYKEKMYGVLGRNLNFSAVGNPSIWKDPPPDAQGNVAHNGSGFVNVGSNDADSENLMAMEVYYDKMAIFSQLSCQLWFLDPNPALNQYYQTLRDAGTPAPGSVRQYVANDVYFLGTHGIRSLRARDLTTTAAVADVGSPLDPAIQELIAERTSGGLYWAETILSPRTGRIWMIFSDRIYVLSNFASPNISAWSVYVPEFSVAQAGGSACFSDPYVVLRAADDKIYRFGAQGALVYDSCPVSFTTPFLSFDKPASFKFYQGFDAICTADPGSVWNIQLSFDPTVAPTPFDQICTLPGPTMMGGRIPVSGRGTHVQVQATHTAPGPATFSKIFLHYAPAETD
jgi:hypothetical protein